MHLLFARSARQKIKRQLRSSFALLILGGCCGFLGMMRRDKAIEQARFLFLVRKGAGFDKVRYSLAGIEARVQ
ncbi:hypothetical protein VSR68_03525 [Paraburkholderia phymatum]|uniref:hypothetical protein n=1 Tax=Paraburkholderia phymatum TaxID=148447 RepID=UPI0031759097